MIVSPLVIAVAFAVVPSLAAQRCEIAYRVAISNIQMRTDAPHVDKEEVIGSFARLQLIANRCPRAVTVKIDDCPAIQRSLRSITGIPLDSSALFASATGCGLDTSILQPSSTRSIVETVLFTLKEEKLSDGEAVLWSTDDLLALLLLYPNEFVTVLDQHPEFEDQFMSDLGGESLNDVGEAAPYSKKEVKAREAALCSALRTVTVEEVKQDGHNVLLELRRVAKCR